MSGSVSYGVGARLQITGNARQVLTALGRSLTSLNAKLTGLEGRLNKVSGLIAGLGSHTASISHATTALTAMAGAVKGVSSGTQGATRAVNAQTAALARNDAMLLRVQATARSAASAMRALALVPPPPRIPPPPRPGRGGGGSGGGGGGGRGRGGHGGAVGGFEDRLSHAGGQARAALGAASGIGSIFEAAGKVQTMETLQRAQQLPEAAISGVQAAIPNWIAQAPGATSADAMQAFNEARAAVGDENGTNFGPAMQIAPMLLRAARVSAITGGKSTSEGLRPLARFLAIRGSFTNSSGELDPVQGASELRALESAMLAFSTAEGEGIAPREWANVAKQMGTAGRRMSIEGIIGPLASLMQEVDGHRAGTMLTAFNDQIIGGTMTKKARGKMADLGLLQKPEDRAGNLRRENEIIDRELQAGRINPVEAQIARERAKAPVPKGATPAIGRALGTVRPDLWVQEVYRPQVEKQIRKANPNLSPAEIADKVKSTLEDVSIDMFDDLGLRSTTERFVMSFLQAREVRSDISNVQRIEEARKRGEDPSQMFLSKSFSGAAGNVTGSFTVLLEQLGRSQAVITVMNEMAASLTRFSNFVRDSPNFREWIDKNILGLWDRFKTTGEEIARVVSAIDRLIASVRSVADVMRSMDAAMLRFTDSVAAGIARLFGFGPPTGAPGAPGSPTPPGQPSGPLPDPATQYGAPPAPNTDPYGSGIQLGSFVPMPPADGGTTVRTAVNLDGRLLTEVVTRHQGRGLNAPIQSPSFSDPRRGFGAGEVVTT